MIAKIKRKLKKIFYRVTGRYHYLRETIKVKKEWYGNDYGGFYVCPDFLDSTSIVYSFGIGQDISFDTDVLTKHNCLVYGFDPTPKSIQWVKSMGHIDNFIFSPFGIGVESGMREFYLPINKSNVSGSFVLQNHVDKNEKVLLTIRSFSDITTDFGHDEITVVKMDIEGGEYEVIDDILKSPIPIKQICIEFHDRFFPDGKAKTIETINKLKEHGYEIFGVSDTYEEISFIKNGS